MSKCLKCRKEKGPEPSLTVRPGLCKKCRDEFTSEDFGDCSVVCMIGKAGSGKDTVADILVSDHGFKRLALADPIRDIVQLVLVLDHDAVWDRELREQPLDYPNGWTVRKLMQYIGTELFREHISEDIWIENLLQRIEPGNDYVVTDVRFPNELSRIEEKFRESATSINVVRDGCDGKSVGIANHESERHDLVGDITIENNGTLEELCDKVRYFIVEGIPQKINIGNVQKAIQNTH